MFESIKAKLRANEQVTEAVVETATAGLVGLKIGLMAGALLIPITCVAVLIEKAAR